MKRSGWIITLVSIALAGCWPDSGERPLPPAGCNCGMPGAHGPAAPKGVSSDELAAFVGSMNQVGFELFDRLPRDERGNACASPLSVLSALGMVAAGARGETAAEMDAALAFSGEGTHVRFQALLSRLVGGGVRREHELAIANHLWVRKGSPVAPDFEELTRRCYGAGVTPLDFGDPFGAADAINGWCRQATRGLIRDIVSPPPANTALVLTNAVYFRAKWPDTFDPADTRPAPFSTAPGVSRLVPTMHATRELGYAELPGLQAVELRYRGDASMLVLLPAQPGSEVALDAALYDRVLRALEPRQVSLALPKFKLEAGYQLEPVLQAMGVAAAFEPLRANFQGLTRAEARLSVGAVSHKATVETDETGSEAAAATAVEVGTSSVPTLPEKPVRFAADHPFLFLIRHRPTGTVLFIGWVQAPAP